MNVFDTDQENFWAGEFGNQYSLRNQGSQLIGQKTAFLARTLRGAAGITKICEFGCNIGLNLAALSQLGDFELKGIEINECAARAAARLGIADIVKRSIIEDLSNEGRFDLTFTVGVLIHIAPEYLPKAYDNLVALSRRYILVAEYYNPTPVSIPYRGHEERLFKRDFAGELIDRHDLELVDYGFKYRRDNHAPMDDVTWFLLRRP